MLVAQYHGFLMVLQYLLQASLLASSHRHGLVYFKVY